MGFILRYIVTKYCLVTHQRQGAITRYDEIHIIIKKRFSVICEKYNRSNSK